MRRQKNVELKLISELMKNSRRSDRQLGQAIGVSQPTVSRMIKRLENEGYIKEYTMIPDFAKLGYEIMALTFIKFGKSISTEELNEARRVAEKLRKETPTPSLLVMNGTGFGYDRVVVTFHENYTSYEQFLEAAEKLPYVDVSKIQSFLICLKGSHFRFPTLANIANHLPKREAKTE